VPGSLINSPLSHALPNTGTGGLGDDDIDVAVFRFTLGIPGFDDRLIPRVVGVALGVMLLVNHVAGAQPTPDAQVRQTSCLFNKQRLRHTDTASIGTTSSLISLTRSPSLRHVCLPRCWCCGLDSSAPSVWGRC
jgi:hypothetical protein